MPVDQLLCPDRERLSQQVIRAVQAVYDAKANLTRALRDKKSTDPFLDPLEQARIAEHLAVNALDSHRKEHKC